MTQYKQDSNQSQVNNFTLPLQVADILKETHRITVLTGAGISAESGLGTFRGKSGIWNQMKPEELASMDGFMANPGLVWEWYRYRRTILATAQPNPAHHALAEWSKLCKDFTLVTQNVDGLHQVAGQRAVLELHGNIRLNRCLSCGKEEDAELLASHDGIPYCQCGGQLRPSVVWFGEELPRNVLDKAIRASGSCQLFLVIGTSAEVYPAAHLPEIAREHGAATLEINVEQTRFSSQATVSILGLASQAVPAVLQTWKSLNLQ